MPFSIGVDMEMVLLFARVFLALVFGVAGIAKVADVSGSRRAIIGFGVPDKLATPLAWCLPFAEILIAMALIPVNTAWVGSIAAFALLLMFAVGIAVNLARGKSPDCHCFGQLHSEPVSWLTFTRNLALIAIAGVIVVLGKNDPGLSAVSWLAALRTGELINLILGGIAVALLASAVVYLRRLLTQQSAVLATVEAMKKVVDEDYAEPPVERKDAAPPLEGLPIGAPAPSFSLASIAGGPVTLDDLLARGKSLLLLFVSPNCVPCETLLPIVKVWEREYSNQLTLALISKGTLKDNQERVEKYAARHLLLQGEHSVAEDYLVKWTPAAVFVSRYGGIASRVAYGDEAIRALVAETVGEDARATAGNGARSHHGPQISEGKSPLRVGDPSPDFSIVDLQGEAVGTKDFRGRDTLLLFWDPGCPHCRAMSEDVTRWEKKPPKGAPRLVFVASGDPERIEEASRNFSARFLHDREFKVGQLFGTSLTPSAVLIDRDGRIASIVAVGLPNVLALAGVRKVELPIASTL
ncbi:MAG: MauE/DoxX family redox-associated membrane protein [Blastocatellia bacterium]